MHKLLTEQGVLVGVARPAFEHHPRGIELLPPAELAHHLGFGERCAGEPVLASGEHQTGVRIAPAELDQRREPLGMVVQRDLVAVFGDRQLDRAAEHDHTVDPIGQLGYGGKALLERGKEPFANRQDTDDDEDCGDAAKQGHGAAPATKQQTEHRHEEQQEEQVARLNEGPEQLRSIEEHRFCPGRG